MNITLSKKQQEVVDFNGGNLLVIAGAGSGKTRVLTEKIKKDIQLLKPGEKVLAITFSNKASDELNERLKLSLGELEVSQKSYVGTTHKFCMEIISSKGSLIGLPDNLNLCESNNDRLQLFKEAIENVPEFKSSHLCADSKENNKLLNKYLDDLSILKRNLESYDAIEDEELIAVFKEYDSILLQQCLIDFDDILRYAYQILTERDSVVKIYRRIYRRIYVDEAQDLNKAQYEIIKILAGNVINVTMVGDPNQSIYGFNGATSAFLEKSFQEDFKAYKIKLTENFRSSRRVIENANIIENSFNVKGVIPIEGEFEVHRFGDEFLEAQYIYEKIKCLTEHGHKDVENINISFEQCAVIARNRYVFNQLEVLFKEKAIPYTLKTAARGSFSSESDIMKAFELGLRLLNNPKDKIHLSSLKKLVKIKNDVNTFECLRNITLNDSYWNLLFSHLNKAWDIIDCNSMEIKFHKSLEVIEVFLKDQLNEINENDSLLISQDLEAWKLNWKNYVRQTAPGGRSLGNFIRTISLGSTYSAKDRGVVLSTVHMTKGLEYDVVFIMGLNEGVFPDYRAINSEQQNDMKQIKEEQHNMFVAITRSKRLCYLTYPEKKHTPWGVKLQNPSRYITKIINSWGNQ